MQKHIVDAHIRCQCEIRYKMFKNGQITPGLFCSDHKIYIDWLTNDRAHILINELKLPVMPWVDKQQKMANDSDKKKKQTTLKEKRKKYQKFKQTRQEYVKKYGTDYLKPKKKPKLSV